MKRNLIGIGILAGLLILGLLAQSIMVRSHLPGAEDAVRAAEAAERGDWEQAARALHLAENRWRSARGISAVLADHGPMEDIDSLFLRAAVCAGQRETAEFMSTCLELGCRLRAMADAHALRWGNLV